MSSEDPKGMQAVPTGPPPSGWDAVRSSEQDATRSSLDEQARQDAIERSRSAPTAQTPPSADEPQRDTSVAEHRRGTADPAPGEADRGGPPTTVLPGERRLPRPVPPRTESRPSSSPKPAGRRRARLALQRLDPWSVFLFSLLGSICLGIVLLVAVAALYALLSSLGVLGSLNDVLGEITGEQDAVLQPVITANRVLGATAVLAAVDVVLFTALATLGALLFNACAALTGGIEVVLGERD